MQFLNSLPPGLEMVLALEDMDRPRKQVCYLNHIEKYGKSLA